MARSSVGIIGLGSFGALAASLLPRNVKVLGYDPATSSRHAKSASFAEVCKCDVVILAVPFETYEKVLPEVANNLSPDALLVDICSIKVKPTALVKKHLPAHKNLLLTHPLFGPQTYDKKGEHVLIVTEKRGTKAEQVLGFCQKKLGLKVVYASAEEHDKSMAHIHALTMFIARGLDNMNIPEPKWQTPSFGYLLKLARLDEKHTEDLFRTIEVGNPYAAEVRQRFLEELQKTDKSLQ